nr:MAG TPA: hypothetical protein [Caudoviricetes sp.]
MTSDVICSIIQVTTLNKRKNVRFFITQLLAIYLYYHN